jgi:fructose-1-phosphate kinase PfkB-like protein
MLIAGPNLTIDRTLSIEELRPGEVLRFERFVVTPGGKGLNVARAARALGHPAVLVSFLPGHTGRAAAALIAREGLELDGVACAGEMHNTAIVLERGGRTTVFDEPRPAIAAEDWDGFERALAARLGAHGVLVCSGGFPPGSPADACERLTALARGAGLRCLVDAPPVTEPQALAAEAALVEGGTGRG